MLFVAVVFNGASFRRNGRKIGKEVNETENIGNG